MEHNRCLDHLAQSKTRTLEQSDESNTLEYNIFFHKPKDYDEIQPILDQVWIVDKIGFDPCDK